MRRLATRCGAVAASYSSLCSSTAAPVNCRRWYSVEKSGGDDVPSPGGEPTEVGTPAAAGMWDKVFGQGFNLTKFLDGINKEDLKSGDDMPPMLQYNQELVTAGLDLLNASTNVLSIDDNAEEAALEAVTEMLFKETFVPFTEQFKIATAVLNFPKLREDETIRKAIGVIVEHVVPGPLFEAWSVVERDQLTDKENELFTNFIVIVLKGDAEEEEFIHALGQLKQEVDWLFKLDKFLIILQQLKETMLQCRLGHLITETCRAFDSDDTGKIKIAELEESLVKVIGEDATKQMLIGAEADEDGNVYYPQMAKILMKGSRPMEVSEKPPQPES